MHKSSVDTQSLNFIRTPVCRTMQVPQDRWVSVEPSLFTPGLFGAMANQSLIRASNYSHWKSITVPPLISTPLKSTFHTICFVFVFWSWVRFLLNSTFQHFSLLWPSFNPTNKSFIDQKQNFLILFNTFDFYIHLLTANNKTNRCFKTAVELSKQKFVHHPNSPVSFLRTPTLSNKVGSTEKPKSCRSLTICSSTVLWSTKEGQLQADWKAKKPQTKPTTFLFAVYVRFFCKWIQSCSSSFVLQQEHTGGNWQQFVNLS